MSAAARAIAHSLLVAAALLAACTHAPSEAPVQPGEPAAHALYAAPAGEVRFETRGRLRPQYRAAGIAGEPLPYEHAVESSLILCAALGPLFGPCAGVLLGGAAVAGVTESAVTALSQPGSAAADEAELRQAFAPDPTYASALGRRIVEEALARLAAAGDAAVQVEAPAPGGCTLAAELHPRAVTAVDVVRLELELEPGFQYRLVLVLRARSGRCGEGGDVPERRYAYRGRPVPIARDPAAARARFEAEIAQAVAALGGDLAAHVSGRPRG
ncbi:MAG: hypothetical protein AB7I32_03690 [Gammaproteobacteria bacterium]